MRKLWPYTPLPLEILYAQLQPKGYSPLALLKAKMRVKIPGSSIQFQTCSTEVGRPGTDTGSFQPAPQLRRGLKRPKLTPPTTIPVAPTSSTATKQVSEVETESVGSAPSAPPSGPVGTHSDAASDIVSFHANEGPWISDQFDRI